MKRQGQLLEAIADPGNLRLALKANVALNKTAFGMDFLGYRLHPGELRLTRRSKLRFARKYRRYEREHLEGHWTERELQERMEALVAFMLPCRSRNWRLHVMKRFACQPCGARVDTERADTAQAVGGGPRARTG